ncbi:NAD(P)H-hydrate epimerase [Tessaracoccus sp. ZS01]|uniref:NAD(P)H-hydrate epimerase n=1 Tax=Tessaracoccus sp. ZS01 TaxID=1906324 RepID=UPI0009701ADD|nr:NAD(P)H-hydrate epimerase [Tessaracoccus sp. ZS01]MCG6566780.1 NAD(P)H-hydrate epimerase [Tessaracoccus sp. ZS01]OMG57925.1 NAD(P)H-hydrate epimerase [Tessaracoccus sp. ZS01]
MKQVISAQQMRDAEQRVFDAEPDVDLMGRAALAVAQLAEAIAPNGPVLVAVGPGNNGGDGLFAAAHLADHRPVTVWPAMGKCHEAGLAAARGAGCHVVDAMGAAAGLADAALVIDAVTGLGSRPDLPTTTATFAEACDAAAVPVLSVDLPSGLDADSGHPHNSFRAEHTITFAALKACHVQQPAASRCGEVHVADIGVALPEGAPRDGQRGASKGSGVEEVRQAEEADVALWWPVPDATSDKYSRGVVMVDTGSEHYQGAALLSIAGAVNAGAGMVRYTGRVHSGLVLTRFPSVVMGEGRAQAMVLGSGWGDTDGAEGRVANAKLHGLPAVVDANALYALPQGRLDGWLLTPHAGELSRMLGCSRSHVENEPVSCAREVARSTGAAVLLKGATQYVAEPSGRVTIAVPGPSWTAQAGSGDVLAGICGTLLAAGLPAWKAGVLGASIQAMTAWGHPGPYPPDVLAGRLPEVIASITPR